MFAYALQFSLRIIHQIIDTNADTCCLGKNFVILHHSYRTADVYAYDSSIKPVKNVPIVTGATAYDDAQSGDTFILVFHESLF